MSVSRAAAIAIGSNSTRMLTADLDGCLSRPVRGRIETKLLLFAGEGNPLSDRAIDQCTRAVFLLSATARREGAEKTYVFATSAVRDAANACSLSHALLSVCGLPLQVIDGPEEAELSYLGATCLSHSTGERGVMDIGGGSTELITGQCDKMLVVSSIQIGATRLYGRNPINSVKDLRAARKEANSLLSGKLPKPLSSRGEWTLVGGTGTALIRICQGLSAGEPFPDGSSFSFDEAHDWLHVIAETPPDRRSEIPGFPTGREHILPTGLMILTSTMAMMQIKKMRVTERNNTDGFLYRLSEKS